MRRGTEKLIHAALRDGCREHCDALIDELRRLAKVEAQRDQLLEALERIAQLSMSQFHIPYDMAAEACNIASAAIKQAEGENT